MHRKILYVDDELESRALVADYLRNLGYEVLTVEQASSALRLASDIRLDAIILDVNLIGMDSPELLGYLQINHPGIPIILYTGMNADDPKVTGMISKGARLHVSKNDPLESLIKAVNEVLK